MNALRLYKYGKRQHMCSLVHQGQLYLSPATKYDDKSLSPGAYDPKELILEQRLPEGIKLEAFDRKTGKSKGELHPVHVGPAIAQLETDYYVFCMSYRYGLDLYEEFSSEESKADTCVVIADPDRFITQAGKAIMRALPDWAVDAGTARYRSLNSFFGMYPTNQDIYYEKTVDHVHQAEIRIVCTPPKPVPRLEPMIVEMGNLYGYTYITGIEAPDWMIEAEHSEALGLPFKCCKENE